MLHQAILATSKPGLTDVTVTIVDRAGTVVVTATPAPLLAGTTSTYAASVTVPDTLVGGRELWSSVQGSFAKFPGDFVQPAPQPVDVSTTSRDAIRAGLSMHSPLDVWNVSQNAAFLPNTLGAKLKLFLLDTFGRVKLSREENVLTPEEAGGIGGEQTAVLEAIARLTPAAIASSQVTPNDSAAREIWRGFDHFAADGRAPMWVLKGAGAMALAGDIAAAHLLVQDVATHSFVLEAAATVEATADGLMAVAELGQEQTILLGESRYDCVVEVMLDSGHRVPLVTGRLVVR